MLARLGMLDDGRPAVAVTAAISCLLAFLWALALSATVPCQEVQQAWPFPPSCPRRVGDFCGCPRPLLTSWSFVLQADSPQMRGWGPSLVAQKVKNHLKC